MAATTLQHTRAHLEFETTELHARIRLAARAASLLETAARPGSDIGSASILDIERAIAVGERELACDPADCRAAELERALAALRAALDDDASPALPIAA